VERTGKKEIEMKRVYLGCALLVVFILAPLAAHSGDLSEAKKELLTTQADTSSSDAAAATASEENKKVKKGEDNDESAAAAEEEAAPMETWEERPINDPLEPLNRAFFTFNDRLYFWVMKPVAQAYTVVPQWGRVRVRNAFHNIRMPVRFASLFLQLKFRAAAFELGSFVINSTFGLGGMFDIAKKPRDIQTEEDLGLTFGHYGVGEGFYLVLPLIGPSCLRDAAGTAGDSFLDPVNYVTPWENAAGIQAGERLNNTSLSIGDYEDFKASALDPYVAMRDAYKQYRRNKIKGQPATAPATP
jgi:phospholipid-binding lipoprotein MlaA